MPKHLEKYLRHPLEREYEAWIIDEVEQYFESININAYTFAISPNEERAYPADELSSFEGKFVGLQFKRALLANGRLSPSRLKWEFYSPSYQLSDVLRFDEIYYCLPTFINRKFRRTSLHHCLFWRPDDVARRVAWYNNPQAHTYSSYQILKNSMRWGLFVEEILSCNIGTRVRRGELGEHLSRITEREFNISEPLYVLLVEMI